MTKSYTSMPVVPSEMLERYRIVMEVLSGAISVSEGARKTGLSRNHFQTPGAPGLGGDHRGAVAEGGGPASDAEGGAQAAAGDELVSGRRTSGFWSGRTCRTGCWAWRRVWCTGSASRSGRRRGAGGPDGGRVTSASSDSPPPREW